VGIVRQNRMSVPDDRRYLYADVWLDQNYLHRCKSLTRWR